MPGTSTILKGELNEMARKFSMNALLNEQSLVKGVKEEGGTYEIRLIPLDDLIPSPGNNYSMEGIEDLADSILQVGLLQNLYVKGPDENGKYMVISGHRRAEALRFNVARGYTEWEKAPCHVDGCQDPLLNELKLLEANAQARVLTQADLAYQAKRRAEIYQELKNKGIPIRGRIRELVAKDMGVSPAQVSRYESINENLHEGLKEAFREERIGVTDAYDLSTLSKEEQAQVLEKFEATGELRNPKKEARAEAKRSIQEPAPVMDKPAPEPVKQAMEEQPAPVADDMNRHITCIDFGRDHDCGNPVKTTRIDNVICPSIRCAFHTGIETCGLMDKVQAWIEANNLELNRQEGNLASIICPFYVKLGDKRKAKCPICGNMI